MPLQSPIKSCPFCRSEDIRRAGFSGSVDSIGGEKRQRFRCLKCKRRFSSNFLSLLYRLKKRDLALNAKIFEQVVDGLCNRSIALRLHISEHCVRIRKKRLSQRALAFHAYKMRDFRTLEPVTMDGLENFAGSQYEVNNINHAILRDSLFMVDFNLCGLNRKGRMSPWQKMRNREIEQDEGRYNPSSIRVASGDLFKRVYKLRANPNEDLVLITDWHRAYRKALQCDLQGYKIEHVKISSKDTRNYQNLLFPINHADLLSRQRLKSFARETISFSKNTAVMCQNFALFMTSKNYMKPQFTKKHVRRPKAHKESPAQAAGVATKILRFEDIFSERSTRGDLKVMNPDWRAYWCGKIPRKYRRSKKCTKDEAV